MPLFATLMPTDRNTLLASLDEKSYPAGTILCYEGDYGDRFYIVRAGWVEIIKALGTDDERRLDVRGPDEFVGEMSLLNHDSRRTASIRACTDIQVLELTRAEFDALLHRYPSIAYEMLRVLSTRLNESNNAAIRDLHEKNRRLAQAYAELQAAQAQIVMQETLMRELELAREIQESMLPASIPQLEGFDLGARMLPARMVGGDFFDVVPLDSNSLGIAIGDVSGKGVPAALFVALVSSLLRAELSRGAKPQEALGMINNQLLARNTKGMFVTLLFGVLRRDTHEFHYVRAGHSCPVVWDAQGTMLPIPVDPGLPLGVFPDLMLDVQSISVAPGSTLLLYTDGATEAMDPEGHLFGQEQLVKHALEAPCDSAQHLCDRLLQAIIDYHAGAPQSDDITLVAVRT